jgi:hypothetical protein
MADVAPNSKLDMKTVLADRAEIERGRRGVQPTRDNQGVGSAIGVGQQPSAPQAGLGDEAPPIRRYL